MTKTFRLSICAIATLSGLFFVMIAATFERPARMYGLAAICFFAGGALIARGRLAFYTRSIFGLGLFGGASWALWSTLQKYWNSSGHQLDSLTLAHAVHAVVFTGAIVIPYLIINGSPQRRSRFVMRQSAIANPARRFQRIALADLTVGGAYILLGQLVAIWVDMTVFLAPFLVVAALKLRLTVVRTISLRRRGFFAGAQVGNYWKYEEIRDGRVESLLLPLTQIESGSLDIYFPSMWDWNLVVPAWAKGRRNEITERVAKHWDVSRTHYLE